MVIGALAAFAAAFAQSLSYIFSKMYMGRFQGVVPLLIVSHVIMGVLSAAVLLFLRMEDARPLAGYMLPLSGCALFYLLGQASFFMALRKTDASRVSPLLGLKILFLAVFLLVFTGQEFSLPQWVAVLMSMSAAMMINWSGGRIPWGGVAWILAACVFYSLSDMNIKIIIDNVSGGGDGLAKRALFSACACYMACGAVGAAALFFIPLPTPGMCAGALPFAVAWFGGVLFLFISFGFIGPVFGNIIQSSRGIVSIALGALVAKAGFVAIEKRTSLGVFARRMCAGALMLVSMGLFAAPERAWNASAGWPRWRAPDPLSKSGGRKHSKEGGKLKYRKIYL